MPWENAAVEDLTTPGVAVVTGASSGIGLAAAHALARLGWTVAMVGRDPDRLASAASRVRDAGPGTVEVFQADFCVLDDVRALADALRRRFDRIDVLANNAGAVVPGYRRTVDGFEMTMQVNHLAPFLLTAELREMLRGGRVVNTSSAAHLRGRLDVRNFFDTTGRYRPLVVYGTAKLATLLFTAEAARRWPDILSVAFHPGVVRTRLGRDRLLYSVFFTYWPFLRTPAKGAQTLVWLATADRSAIVNGGYYVDLRQRQPAAAATDAELAARLWEESLAAVSGRPAA